MNNMSNIENEKRALAARCEMGDTAAMMEMANLFFRQTGDYCRKLAAEYDSGKESKEKFLSYMKENSDERKNILCGNMWVGRAALYGHAEAKRMFAENSVYEEYSLMGIEMFMPGKRLSCSADSEILRYAGFLGFPKNEKVDLSSLENGVYMATTNAGTEGPDEDGFGMEELYDFYQFDEFFHLLHTLKEWSYHDLNRQKVSPFAGRAEEAEKERKEYWSIHAGRQGETQYIEQSIAADDFIIRNGVLTKCMKSDLTHAEIPFGVTRIADNAFAAMGKLESVTIPDSVTEIGGGAFRSCRTLKKVYLPDSVREIGERVFAGCTALEFVHLPDELVRIPKSAFYSCFKLKTIDIPDTVTELGEECFARSGAERLNLPENLRKIEKGAFKDSRLTEIVLPQSVKDMGSNVFERCENLKYAKLPDNLKALPWDTFSYCDALEEVCLPQELVSIGSRAFVNCKSLKRIACRKNDKGTNMLPETLEKIGLDAFENCKALSAIGIAARVKEIPCSAFRGCTRLRGIDVSRDNPYFSAEGDMLFDKKKQTLIFVLEGRENAVIPNGTKKIGGSAFSYNQKLRRVVIAESVEEIGNAAFFSAKSLESVSFGSNVKVLGQQAFQYCSSLKKISLPQGLTEIGCGCFEDCKSLEQITIPSGVEVLQAGVFAHCESLREIYISDGVREIGKIFGISSIARDVLKSIRIPASVTVIDEYLLWNPYGRLNNLTIIGKRGSLAEQIANKEKIRFKAE